MRLEMRLDRPESRQALRVLRHLACSEVVVRGGVEPPTFRFSGGLASPGVSTTGRLTRPYDVLAPLEVQDHPPVSTAVVSKVLARSQTTRLCYLSIRGLTTHRLCSPQGSRRLLSPEVLTR